MSHNAREGAHDDILLGLAIGLFHADKRNDRTHANWMEFMRLQAGGGYSVPKPAKSKPSLRLRAPTNISTVYTMTGRSLNVSENGTVEVNEDEASSVVTGGLAGRRIMTQIARFPLFPTNRT